MGGVVQIGEALIMPKHFWFFSKSYFPFCFIRCVLQVQAYGDPAQYLECFNLAVLVIHNLAVQVEWKTEDGWTLVLAPCNTNKEIEYIFIPKSQRSQTSTLCLQFVFFEFTNPHILGGSCELMFFGINFQPKSSTQAENLELLHSEPRILRVLLEVGPFPRNVDEGKDEGS